MIDHVGPVLGEGCPPKMRAAHATKMTIAAGVRGLMVGCRRLSVNNLANNAVSATIANLPVTSAASVGEGEASVAVVDGGYLTKEPHGFSIGGLLAAGAGRLYSWIGHSSASFKGWTVKSASQVATFGAFAFCNTTALIAAI